MSSNHKKMLAGLSFRKACHSRESRQALHFPALCPKISGSCLAVAETNTNLNSKSAFSTEGEFSLSFRQDLGQQRICTTMFFFRLSCVQLHVWTSVQQCYSEWKINLSSVSPEFLIAESKSTKVSFF